METQTQTPEARDAYVRYLQTPQWRSTRNASLKAAGYRCSQCKGKRDLQVHHRTYARVGHEEPEDLAVLCATCHEQHHFERGTPQVLGLYLRIVADLVAVKPAESIADLSEALKRECVRLKIAYDPFKIQEAIAISASRGKHILLARVSRPPTEADIYAPRPTSAPEARELLRMLGIRPASGVIKAMPTVELRKVPLAKLKAMRAVQQLMVESIQKCEELENDVVTSAVKEMSAGKS